MLQNLSIDKRKDTRIKRLTRLANQQYRNHSHFKYTDSGFKVFKPYQPSGEEYVKDHHDKFTGVYVFAEDTIYSPFVEIDKRTKQYSIGRDVFSFLCDNASQAIDLYSKVKSGVKDDMTEWFIKECEASEDLYGKYCSIAGNHVIILWEMTDFRWHKWHPYIGQFNHCHEYFSQEEGIKQVYHARVFKVF